MRHTAVDWFGKINSRRASGPGVVHFAKKDAAAFHLIDLTVAS